MPRSLLPDQIKTLYPHSSHTLLFKYEQKFQNNPIQMDYVINDLNTSSNWRNNLPSRYGKMQKIQVQITIFHILHYIW